MSIAHSDLRVMAISDAAPERNGVGTYYGDLREHLAPEVSRFEILAPGGEVGDWISIPLPGDATQRVGLPSLRRFAARVRQLDPHLLLIATPGPYGLYGGRLARRLGIPAAFGFHTHLEHLTRLYWGPLLGRVARWYLETTTRHLFRRSTMVLCHSQTMLEAARALGARNTRLASTLLPAAFLAPAPPVRPRIERVLFVGRLALEKRVDRLLDAARELPDLRFAFAGDGPLREQVAAAAADLGNVTWLGWRPREQIPALLAAHDLLALPSEVESFGTVALEAMACARTPLVSARCGIRDWPDLAQAAFAFDPDESLATALRRACATPLDERQAIAARGREAAMAMNRRGIEDWLGLLQGLADEGRAR